MLKLSHRKREATARRDAGEVLKLYKKVAATLGKIWPRNRSVPMKTLQLARMTARVCVSFRESGSDELHMTDAKGLGQFLKRYNRGITVAGNVLLTESESITELLLDQTSGSV
jgi:hypothetical protein